MFTLTQSFWLKMRSEWKQKATSGVELVVEVKAVIGGGGGDCRGGGRDGFVGIGRR